MLDGGKVPHARKLQALLPAERHVEALAQHRALALAGLPVPHAMRAVGHAGAGTGKDRRPHARAAILRGKTPVHVARSTHLLVARLGVDHRLFGVVGDKVLRQAPGLGLALVVVAGLEHVEVQAVQILRGNRAVAAVDVHGAQSLGRALCNLVERILVIGNRLVTGKVRVARHHIDGIELAQVLDDAGNMGTDLLARHNLGTATLGNLGAPGTGHVVAPHEHERRADAVLDGSAAHGSGAVPVCLVGTGPIKVHAILAGVGPNTQIGAAAIPLRQRVDLQHVHALLGAARQIVIPVGLGNAGKCAPARIGKPKERLALAQKTILTTVDGQLSQTHLHVLSLDKGIANRQKLSRKPLVQKPLSLSKPRQAGAIRPLQSTLQEGPRRACA